MESKKKSKNQSYNLNQSSKQAMMMISGSNQETPDNQNIDHDSYKVKRIKNHCLEKLTVRYLAFGLD